MLKRCLARVNLPAQKIFIEHHYRLFLHGKLEDISGQWFLVDILKMEDPKICYLPIKMGFCVCGKGGGFKLFFCLCKNIRGDENEE